MSGTVVRMILALAIVSGAACSLPTVLNKNLHAITASTAAISANNDVVKHSPSVTEAGIKSFEGLRKPMESLASLNPRLEAVAALDGPMRDVAGLKPDLKAVAGLAPQLQAVGGLGQPMTGLVNLKPS